MLPLCCLNDREEAVLTAKPMTTRGRDMHQSVTSMHDTLAGHTGMNNGWKRMQKRRTHTHSLILSSTELHTHSLTLIRETEKQDMSRWTSPYTLTR